ncbi:FAD-dependent oxidoreductase [Rhodococcus sp. ADH]|uniref:phytoene desaturase family protein n=1 Tax=unclassified Rhodococcus (in: high G+C Gram-positive bacteria) TaxID=192944 RepID=UPI0006BA2A74|nr:MULTISPECIES: NAD(P)/FAD-dependent oxidoreductase [unclassified Rhodococcus (in: high G+C Gram-positive bacteria)]KPH20538.1 FAD-dependent oxidoreductase [Rhodococcus sp. ADH]RGP48070.1 FAD-dependent oxidoreductase [Rhodococcus erythropolis]
MVRAVVVGSGPNGLAAGLSLALAGVDITVLEAKDQVGGGTASAELTLPGLIHDVCSGFHPLAVDNAFSRSVDLEAHGLQWRWPEIQYSHPLGTEGDGAAAFQSQSATAHTLGVDAVRWKQVFGSLIADFPQTSLDVMQPMARIPRHPVKLAKFGLRAAVPATVLASAFKTEQARALLGGVAAHGLISFGRPLSASVGTALAVAAHTYGWPVAEGGSAAISQAMTAALRERGARIHTGVAVTTLRELRDADLVMLDVSPSAAITIMGDLMPSRIRRSLRSFRHGPAAFKVDYAIDGGVPWKHLPSRAAGTVHLGGTFSQIRHAENQVLRGRVPAEPFVLVGQQFLADPTRSHESVNPLYAYAHVPHGFTGDLTDVVTATIERYAPGFRERIVAQTSTSPRQMERANANYVGGDIIGGASTPMQIAFRPRPARDPYWLGYRNVFLCSSSTPPGAGAHGMCGYNAAMSALRRLGIRPTHSDQ